MRTIGRALLTVTLLGAATVSAQTTVVMGEPFTFSFNHDGLHTDGYRVYVDNVRVSDIPVSALQNGGVSHTSPGTLAITRGAHILGVSAYNADRESARSTVPFTAVLPAPTVPANLTITLQIALNPDGTVSLTWAALDASPPVRQIAVP